MRFVKRARQLGGAVAGAVRRAVDPPVGSDARPLDVKRAIVETIEQQLEPAGGGRRVLPADAVRVTIVVDDAHKQRALEDVLRDLRQTVAARLQELRCVVSPRFAVETTYVEHRPADWEDQQAFAVQLVREDAAKAERDQHAAAGVPTLSIVVIRGQAEKSEVLLNEPVVRIGRSLDPTDERGRPRYNHVAFLENDSVENRTVTRGHAVIRFNPQTREYRLFDEGSANGTRVIRRGDAIDLPRRDPVGFALFSGDEVQLGKAAIRIDMPPGDGPHGIVNHES